MMATTVQPNFQQFRLTDFVSAPSNTKTPAHAHAFPTSTNLSTNKLSEDEPIAQGIRPSSRQKNTESQSRATMAQENSSPHMGLLELVNHTANTSIEGVLGPNKDGRVRNPVPSKLKGKTDTKQGNFGVMHMGQSPGKKTEAQARDSAAERDAAARRTSENTASRAKAAQQDKYMPPKKRGLEATLNDRGSRGSPFAVSKNDDRNRARPLAPDETKFEQARLLTLLRSINPVTVVDQICKAVAYFGGIPGAPPPEDGIFPESANTRETGALFIGWVAEIFPDLSSRSPEVPTKVAVQAGKKKNRPSAVGKKEIDTGDSEPPNSRNGYGYGPAIFAPAWGLPQSLALVNTPIPVPVAPNGSHGGAIPIYEQNTAAEQLPDTPIKSHYEDPNETAAAKRRRGRPKGSRNKGGKGEGEPDSGSNIAEQQASPEMASDTTNNQLPAGYGMITQQPNMQKPTQTYQYPAQSWNNAPKSQNGQTMAPPADDQLSPEERAVLEAFRHGVDTSITSSITPVPPPIVPVKNATGGNLPNEKKRKRAPAKPKQQIVAPTNSAPAVANPPAEYVQASQNTPILPPTNLGNNTMVMGQSQDPIQWSSTATTTPILPLVKKPRVRKPKAPAPAPVPTEPPARIQTASVVSNATPPISASTIPDLQATIPQTSQPVARPPAEGLEAHYERFAFSQNGRSNTPTVQPQAQQQQQQQQQPRQQSKPTSVPPQQSTPQLQHQQLQHHQMQQQKSQQGGQQQSLPKDDHKVTQATSSTSSSSRPTSTSYYSNQQRAQPTGYNQQYPTHQSSQLYAGHQTTPQLANNSSTTTATNTYNNRTYNSHALAQASPQFSQSEASYRTASPHTIAQPSPSFSQTESGFRTNSHTITQPTASYSQPENPYRAPTTHAMAQPTASYAQPRTHTQPQASHQSHYSHFSDSSFIDLPTLESLGHASNNASSGSVGMGVGGYGQSLGIGHGTSRTTGGSNSLYGTSSGLSNAYDTSSNDLLRGVSRSGSNPNSGYGTGPSGLGAFDNTGNTEQDLRERLMRGMGRR